MASRREMGHITGTQTAPGTMPKIPPYLQKRGNVWRFRMRVPDALQPIIRKREFRVSLKTESLREAIRLAQMEALKAGTAFDQARRTLAMRTGSAPKTELTNVEAMSLASEWLHLREKQDDLRHGIDPLDAKADLYVASDPQARVQVWRETSKFLIERGIDIEFDSPSYQLLAQRIQEAQIEAEKRLLVRYSGEAVALNPRFEGVSASTPLPNAGSVVTFEQLLADYRKYRGSGSSPKTKLKQDAQDRLFKEILGAKTPIKTITRDAAKRVREVIERLPPNFTKRFPGVSPANVLSMDVAKLGKPMTATTANSYLFALSGVFDYAVTEELIDRNPAKNLRMAGDGTLPVKTRATLTPSECCACH
jgi:hypothetical protein